VSQLIASRRRPAPRRRGRHATRSRRRPRAAVRRRRLALLAVVAALGAGVWAVATGVGPLGEAVREITLPLRHDDIIRQQAADKDLDPALIAAVIYQETRFRPRRSEAGAEGLMQIVPDTARFIARRSGGTAFELRDLDEPQISVAYGSWYLRYLIQHYDGNVALALAAYNGGMTNVDRWVNEAGGPDAFDHTRDIPFPETRDYVSDVLDRRDEYRKHYADELGL
jgi:soluble lytic murein transglycosylase